ncbi:septum formation family protein [Microbacterium sp. Se5.02b]|nr:septum formation family protein [Microbacterium sp. Se5.02b]
MMPSVEPAIGAGGTRGYPPAAGYPGLYGSTPAATPEPARSSPLGIVAVIVVVVGVVCACVPVIAIAGWAILAIGLVLSTVSLFLRGRKWPGITGLAVGAVGSLLAIAVSLITLVATSPPAATDDPPPLAVPTEQPETDGGAGPGDIEGAEMVPFAELEVGDCLPFVDDGDAEQIYELPVVPCDSPHTDEVFFIFEVEDGAFPGDDALGETAWDGCLAQFDDYVGIPYDDSTIDFYTYQPTKGSWARADDRTVQCILFSYDDVTGTLRNAGY